MNFVRIVTTSLQFILFLIRKTLKKVKHFLMRNTVKKTILNLLIMAAVAIFATWLLEYRYYSNHAEDVWNFVQNRNLVFWYSVIIMFFLELFIYGIVRRVCLSSSILISLVTLIGYIHIEKLALRGTPLFPEDFQLGDQAGSLMHFVSAFNILRTVLATAITIGIGAYLDKKMGSHLRGSQLSKRYPLLLRVAILAVALLGFMNSTDFARNHDGSRTTEIPWLNSKFTAWNQTWNYNDNGFLIAFIYNTGNSFVHEPDGYSKERINEIVKGFRVQKKADTERIKLADTDFNIVVILGESFYDPEQLRDYYNYIGDVTPNLHRLQRENPSGTMYSIDYGGGTANVEFETITGLTNYWINAVPYTGLIPKKNHVGSIADFVKGFDFETVTIHPFNGGMYKRNSVLPILGFDSFITVDDFKNTEHENTSEYINDKSAFTEVLDYLSSHKEKQFVSLITMQNHIPYLAETYPDNPYVVTDAAGERYESIETYLMTLQKSDEYLGEFIAALDAMEEKTLVLFYGDHSPGVFKEVLNHEDKNVRDLIRKTPYFIHSNFDLEITIKDLPTTTPNCLMNTLFDAANLEKPAYFYLVADVCVEQPILSNFYFGDKLPFNSTELSSYQLLTYDLVAGKQYSLK